MRKVWNKRTLSACSFIGMMQLQKHQLLCNQLTSCLAETNVREGEGQKQNLFWSLCFSCLSWNPDQFEDLCVSMHKLICNKLTSMAWTNGDSGLTII